MDKRQTKQSKHKQQQSHAPKRPTLTLQKRNELTGIVTNLLEVSFKTANNPTEEWSQYLEIQQLLQRIMALEVPLLRPTVKGTPETRLANIEQFYNWVRNNGVKYEGVEIAEFPGYDLGLQATRDIVKEEVLFSIPRHIMLSEECLEGEFNHSQFGTMTNLKLAYALMLETLKPDSYWKPYIDLLPDKYPTVLYFTIEEMEQLRGSNALSSALRQCKAIARQYAFIYNCTQKASVKDIISQLGLVFREQFNYDLYRWAVSTVMTRENMIPRLVPTSTTTPADDVDENGRQPIAALIPFWDMANHQHGTVTSYYNIETEQMESNAPNDFQKGEQIFIHYGDRSNADLMVHNGFVNPNNPKDSVYIKLGLSTSDPLFEPRSKLLELLSLPKMCELQVLPAPEHISQELLAFVRVFNMNADQLQHWITSDRARDLFHMDCALETSLESKTWQYLQTRLMLLLRVFPTTLEADEAKLAEHHDGTVPLAYIPAMILQYRVLEKRILLGALDYVKQRAKA